MSLLLGVPAARADSALVAAAQKGDTEMARALLAAKGVEIDGVDAQNGFSALMWAANGGNAELVKLLLARGAKPDLADSVGQTALFLAMSKPIYPGKPKTLAAMVEIVKALVAAGANVDAQLRAVAGVPQGVTPLRFAAVTEFEVMKALVEAGANVNIMDAKGVTPLMATVDQRWGATSDDDAFAKARLLIDHGAVVDAPVRSLTPLMMALWNGFTMTAHLLIASGASTTAKSNNGTTMLMFACKCGDPDLVRDLLQAGADPRLLNNAGDSALSFVLSDRNEDAATQLAVASMTDMLLARKVDSKRPNAAGVTPLMMAARTGILRVFAQVLAEGSDPFALDGRRSTALMYAAAGGNPSIVEKLLALGLNPRAVDLDGDTPLHWAAARHRTSTIEFLLSTGAELEASNAAGKTPLSLAVSCDEPGSPAAVALLLERGANPGTTVERARRCPSPDLQRAALEAIANRAFRQNPAPATLDLLVLKATDSQEDADAALAGWQALSPSLDDVVQMATGYPRVVTATEMPTLGAGYHVVLGACTAADSASRKALLSALYPRLEVRALPLPLAHYACPVILNQAQVRTASSHQLEAGDELALASLRLTKPGMSPHARFEALLWSGKSALRGHASHLDFKYQRYCNQARYEENVAQEDHGLRLVVGCVNAEVAGKAIGRVVDVLRFVVGPEGLSVVPMQGWEPPAPAP